MTTDRGPHATVLAVTVDCEDPLGLAAFWSSFVGGTVDDRTASPDWVSLRDVPGIGYLSFQRVPENKSVKNRVHLDLEVHDMAGAVATALALGASLLGDLVDESTNLLQVLADPEGNEFCLIQRTPRS